MVNVKINDLALAGGVADTMQFETDIGGTIENRVTVAQLSDKIIDTDLGITTTLANAIQTTNATTDGLAESTTVLTSPAANQFQLTNGTSDLLVTNDCTIDQSLSTTSAVSFSSVNMVNLINEFSIDGTLSGNSDLAVPTEKAVRTYVTNNIVVAVRELIPVSFDGKVSFTIGSTPTSAAAFKLFRNGQLRTELVDYTLVGTTLTWLDPVNVSNPAPDGEILLTTDKFIAIYNDQGVGAGTLKSIPIYATDPNSNYGNYRTRLITGVGSHRFDFVIPDDFASLISIKQRGIVLAGAAGAGKNIDLTSDYSGIDQASNFYSETDTTTLYDFTGKTGQTIYAIDYSIVLSNLAAGQSGGILLDHNSIGGSIHYLPYIDLKYISS